MVVFGSQTGTCDREKSACTAAEKLTNHLSYASSFMISRTGVSSGRAFTKSRYVMYRFGTVGFSATLAAMSLICLAIISLQF